MKSVSLSKTSRWHKVLARAGGFADGADTLCDITRNLLAMLGSVILCLIAGFVLLWPYGDLLAWAIFMVFHSFQWIPPNGVVALVGTAYTVIALAIIAYRYLPIVLDRTRFYNWWTTEVNFTVDSTLFRILNRVAIAEWQSEHNTRIALLKRTIGCLFAGLLLLFLFTACILCPIVGVIVYVYTWVTSGHIPSLDSPLYKSAASILAMWFIVGCMAFFEYWSDQRKAKKKTENVDVKTTPKSNFAVNLWRTLKDKTCVKIEVVD